MICPRCKEKMMWRPGNSYICYWCAQVVEQEIRDAVAERIPGLGNDPNEDDR